MRAVRQKTWFRALALIAPLTAIAPLVLGLSGGWIALHLAGGLIALAVLVVSGLLLPSPWRWYAAIGVVVSIATITIVTSGTAIGQAVQIGILILLGAIYIACVIWPHG